MPGDKPVSPGQIDGSHPHSDAEDPVPVKIRQAEVNDAEVVARLVHALLAELTPPELDPPSASTVHDSTVLLLNAERGIWALLAEDANGEALGVLTLHECAAIYAGGRFGEISELYVAPAARSERVGPALIDEAVRFGRTRRWRRLEVGAPKLPKWSRSRAFYLRYGFLETGPRLRLPFPP
jgi:GNAT superfamily N-acetyltransferase